jgi:hypothetical protein
MAAAAPKGTKKDGYATLSMQDDDIGLSAQGRSSPEFASPFFSWTNFTFSWMTPLVRQGSIAPLQVEDLFDLSPQDHSAAVSARFEERWTEELASRPGEWNGGGGGRGDGDGAGRGRLPVHWVE